MSDLPDWVRMVQVAVTVENIPIVPEAATERAAGAADKYSGTDQTYETVASWTVATDKIGELHEILIRSDDYDYTHIKVTIGAVTWAEDWSPQDSMPIIFQTLKLAKSDVVKVEAKSIDGTAIEVDAIIVGTEVG